MTISVKPPFPIMTDVDGTPLEDGYIYIGVSGLPAQANPITAYWDIALTIPALQPIRTLGGYPMRSGSPAVIYTTGGYSIEVLNKNSSMVYQSLAITERLGPENGVVSATSSTGSAVIPSGSTAQRDGSPVFGYTRGNSTKGKLEFWNGTAWESVGAYASTDRTSIAAGTVDAITVAFTPAIAAFDNGPIWWRASGANVTTTPTLKRDGLTAKTIVKGSNQALTAGDIHGAGAWMCSIYDVTLDKEILLNPFGSASSSSTQIQPISASVAANALTISASALSLSFRSTTLGSGTVTTVSGTPANLVISSGSTLGTVSAVQSDIVVIAINNAGTIELAAVNISGGTQLDETNLLSTTAEGGAGAADSASVVYSTTARTNVAYRVLGIIRSTQATAGTWATAPSLIQGQGGNALTGLPRMVLTASQATTSGTSIDFTGIPSWAKKITVMLSGVSTNGTSNFLVQIGSGSVDTATYVSAATTNGTSTASSTSGFILAATTAAAATVNGSLLLTLVSGNIWVGVSSSARNDGNVNNAGGNKTTSGTLDRLRLTTVNGTDTFDAGSAALLIEGY